MSILDFFRPKKKLSTAHIAKERLQIIVAHQRTDLSGPDYLIDMRKDILSVIQKYVAVKTDDVTITFDNRKDVSILELNVTLPE